MLKIKDEWITSNMEQKIIEAATIQPLAEYTMEKFNWTKAVYDGIDWEAIKQGRKGYSKSDNIRITKLMFDWVNTGHQKAKMNQEKCCTCCGARRKHSFICSSVGTHKWKRHAWRALP